LLRDLPTFEPPQHLEFFLVNCLSDMLEAFLQVCFTLRNLNLEWTTHDWLDCLILLPPIICPFIFYWYQMIVNLGKWLIVGRHDSDDGSSLTYISATEQPFEEQFLYFFAQIYYSLYGYRRRFYPYGVLPTLEEQGFPRNFEVGEIKYLTLWKKS
jgi:hypothetical protein